MEGSYEHVADILDTILETEVIPTPKTKWTSGPWHLVGTRGIVGPLGEYIGKAITMREHLESAQNEDEADANGRLISLAPELVEVLRAFIAIQREADTPEKLNDMYVRAVNSAESILARLDGK